MSSAETLDQAVAPPESAYLSPAEFVELSGLSLSTVRRYLRDGCLPKFQPGGSRCRVLIPRVALDTVEAADRKSVGEPKTASSSETKHTLGGSSSEVAPSGPAPRLLKRR